MSRRGRVTGAGGPRSPRRLSLATLVAPASRRDFLDHFHARRPMVAHGGPQRLPELFDAPELSSLAAVLGCPSGRTRVWFDRADGSHGEIVSDAAQATRLFTAGDVTVVVDGLELAAVSTLMQRVAADLGTPHAGVSCNVYIAPAGRRTRMHFDQHEVFVVQLHGRKQWRFARNRQVDSPTEPYFGARLVPALAAQLTGPLPRRMPRDATTAELAPGSVLFLPRGTWHEASAAEDSISLTLAFQLQTWTDLLLAALSRRLHRRPEWRAVAGGLIARGPRQAAAARELERRLRALAEELDATEVNDFFAPPAVDRRR